MNFLNPRLERLKSILACPKCGSSLSSFPDRVSCANCSASYPIRNGKIYFLEVPARKDTLDSVKSGLKKLLGKYYYKIGVSVFAPTYPFNFAAKIGQRVNPTEQVVVDIGCGNNRIHKDVIGLDLFDFEAVDLVCDLASLPFKPNSVDTFVSRSVLEHVKAPHDIVKQLYFCTKPGGLSIHLIPFLFPFHASPHDFQRYTHKGHETLFAGWDLLEQTNPTGPVSLALLCFIEFLSILIAVGHRKLKAYSYLCLCALFFPFKYLDIFFVNRKRFLTLAPSIFTVARKNYEA